MTLAMSKKVSHAKEVAIPHSVTGNFIFFHLLQAGIRCYLHKCSHSAMASDLLFDLVHYSAFIVLDVMDHFLKLPV